MASQRALAHAPWSASKIHTALRCPRLFHYRYVDKLKEPEVMMEARVGKAIHTTLEVALKGTQLAIAKDEGRKDLDTDEELGRFDRLYDNLPAFLDRIEQFRRRHRVGRQLIEFTAAVREDFSRTAFYAGDALYRGILDVGYFYGDGNLALVDHKTGARIYQLDIVDQMEGYAVLAAAQFPSVRRVWLGIHWVRDVEVVWSSPMSTAQVANELQPRVLDNIEAAALAIADGPREHVGSHCQTCMYRTVCPSGRAQRFEPVDVEPDPYVDL